MDKFDRLLAITTELLSMLSSDLEDDRARIDRSVELASQNQPSTEISEWLASRGLNAGALPPRSRAYAVCAARAIACVPYGTPNACPREPHDHDPCLRPDGHNGPHSWWPIFGEGAAATEPGAPPRITYVMPGRPVTGRRVEDKYAGIWRCDADGDLTFVGGPIGPGGRLLGCTSSWGELLMERGPLTLLDETEAEQQQAQLYGPADARWGDPDQPCPYVAHQWAGRQWTTSEHAPISIGCTLGFGHAGPHRDVDGVALGEDAHGHAADTERAPDCTCGHPAKHEPGCPRYAATYGVIDVRESDGEPLLNERPYPTADDYDGFGGPF